jgi:hypothetical protein
MRFLQKSYIFRFLTSDSISQLHGEGDFAIHYTIDTQFWGSLASLFRLSFLYINVATCERCLTVYVWSERASVWDFVVLLLFLLVVDSSSFLSFYWLLVGVVFREGFYY